MLEFFRKHQKGFFLFTALIVVASFAFFGTFGTFGTGVERGDRELGRLINGERLLWSDFQAVRSVISRDRYEQALRSGIPHLFNDGVLRRDLLSSGVGAVLARHYKKELAAPLAARLEKIRRYKMPSHPDRPDVGMAPLLQRGAPDLWSAIERLQAPGAGWEELIDVYLLQSRFSPDMVKRALAIESQSLGKPEWLEADFALFGMRDAGDWLGAEFLDLAAQFILQGAAWADERGYGASREEAAADLKVRFEEAMSAFDSPPISWEEQWQLIGMSEERAIDAWRRIVSFRNYFDGVAGATLIDRESFAELGELSREEAVVDLYTLPPLLRAIRSPRDWLEYDRYVSVACGVSGTTIPTRIKPLAEIAVPEFVERPFSVAWKKVDLEALGRRVPLKEILAWEVGPGWTDLRRRCGFLPDIEGKEARLAALDALRGEKRGQADREARIAYVVAEKREWLQAALDAAEEEEREVWVAGYRSNLEEGGKELLEWLLAAADPGAFESGIGPARRVGSFYCALVKPPVALEWRVARFDALKRDGTLKRWVDRQVAQEGDGEEVTLFRKKSGKQAVGELFVHEMKQARDQLAQGQEPPAWIAPFALHKQRLTMRRASQEHSVYPDPFILLPKDWSPVREGELSFLFVEERRLGAQPVLEEISFGYEVLAAGAKRKIAERLLGTLTKEALVKIPVQSLEGVE